MSKIKTFDNSLPEKYNKDNKNVDAIVSEVDALYAKQKEDVSKMRASLLSCSEDNASSLKTAIQNITVMQIYHHLTRIIRYTEMMDKLEDEVYGQMNELIDAGDARLTDLIMLQTQLQKNMIESYKLLQPYMDVHEFDVVNVMQDSGEIESKPQIMNAEQRDSLRTKAQLVLHELNAS